MVQNKKEQIPFEVVEYNPEIHDVASLIIKQATAVANGDCQMLPWEVGDGKIVTPEGLPFYVGLLGVVGVAGAGLTQLYSSTNSVELGGAFVDPDYRGNKLYHRLTTARLEHAAKHGYSVISFTNTLSHPILTNDFGMQKVDSSIIPPEAFIPCQTCNDNPDKGCPATAQTCCHRESIVMLNGSRVE